MSQSESAQVIGSIMYLMICTRHDVAYGISRLSRYTHNPSKDHSGALRRLLRYLIGIMDWGIHYSSSPAIFRRLL